MDPRRRGTAAILLLGALLLLPPAPARALQDGDAPGEPEDGEKEWFRREVAVFEPFERSAPRGTDVRFRLRLRASYRAPVLMVIFPDGDARYFWPESRKGDQYEFLFRLDRRGGTHRVALAADSAAGVLYAARFRMEATGPGGKRVERDVDLPEADAEYPALDPEEHPLRLERILFHRMNALRVRLGQAPLPWHEGVARAAREQVDGIARHHEETLDARTGRGEVVHRVPGAGPRGTNGPSIADRASLLLGWPAVRPFLPREAPEEGRDRPDYLSESITEPVDSLDRKFEQAFLRKSDLRAPMVSGFLTHAAGAASWRWYGWRGAREGEPLPAEPPPAPAGRRREAMAILVFVQVQSPQAEERFRRDRAEAEAAPGRASRPAEKAEALRRLGQFASAGAPRALREAAKSRDPVVRAAALDGLWLCAPEAARALSAPLRAAVLQASEEGEEAKAAEGVRVLALCRYDAASRREAEGAARTIRARARAVLEEAARAAAGGRTAEARSALEAARARFAGFPEAEEAAAALRALPAAPPGPGGR